MAYGDTHLTEAEAKQIAKRIEAIGRGIQDSGKSLDSTMQFLISGSKGEEIDQFRDLGKKLIIAIGDLATCALDIGGKIGNFIMAMVRNDKEGAQKIRDSFN